MKKETKPRLDAGMKATLLRLSQAQKMRLAERLKKLPPEDRFLEGAIRDELTNVEKCIGWLG